MRSMKLDLVAGRRLSERGSQPAVELLQRPHYSPTLRTADSAWRSLQVLVVRHEFLAPTTLVLVASTVVIAPMLVLGTVSGRDFPFHLASWMDVARQWHHGTIYPQWAELANWGFGEPRFVFYPPGSWMLGAALGSLLPWKMVPTLFVWLVLIGAGISMFLLARESMPRQQAVLAAMFFAANPYHLLLVYYRSDFAELLASAFFPLLPWGVMRIARDGWRRVPILALVVGLIWLSNAPAAVIAVYSLVLLVFIAYAVRRDPRLLIYGSAAAAGGFGLAAFYILPAAHERAWVQINQVLTDGLRPEQNFLFTRATSMAVNTDFNLKISCVVLLMGALTAAAAFYVAKSLPILRLHYSLMAALGTLSFFMMFRVSRFLWQLAPELHFVQFPWRYVVPLAVAFAFFLGAVAGKFSKLAILAVGVFVFAGPIAKIFLAIKRPASWNRAEISQFQQNIEREIGYRGTPEYLPNGANDKVSSESAGTETVIASEGSEFKITNTTGDRKTFRIQSAAPRQIAVSLFDYPDWQVDLDGSRVSSKLTDNHGRVAVDLPAGNHVIHISHQRNWDAKLGIAISIATAVFLLCLTFLSSRHNKLSAVERREVDSNFPGSTIQASALSMGNSERS